MKVLYITTIGGTMGFFKSFIEKLLEEGNIADIATNECNGDSRVPECYREWGCKVYPISCTRSPLKLGNARAIGEIRDIVRRGKYDIVHCHTPIAAACTRLACRNLRKNNNTKVLYTAHGFHFFKGAPLINWLLFYPVEKWLSRYTDVLITINKEDYNRSKKNFHAKKTEYVPGVGIDTEKFAPCKSEEERESVKIRVREEIGIPLDAKLIISVGELSKRKNHKVVVEALQKMPADYWYVIVGKGQIRQELLDMDRTGRLKLLGYREDIVDLLHASDVFVFPSIQEGLPVALMEAIAADVPCLASNIRGNNDLVANKDLLFHPKSVLEILNKMNNADFYYNNRTNHTDVLKTICAENVNIKMKKIYLYTYRY